VVSVTNPYGHSVDFLYRSSEPLTQNLFSASNSQPNNRSNDSKDGRIRNSVDSRGKADVNIYDDNSFC
jgi:hypothetical protein